MSRLFSLVKGIDYQKKELVVLFLIEQRFIDLLIDSVLKNERVHRIRIFFNSDNV